MINSFKDVLDITLRKQIELGYQIKSVNDVKLIIKKVIYDCLNDKYPLIPSDYDCKEILINNGKRLINDEIIKESKNFDKALEDYCNSYSNNYFNYFKKINEDSFLKFIKLYAASNSISKLQDEKKLIDLIKDCCDKRNVKVSYNSTLKIFDEYITGKFKLLPLHLLMHLKKLGIVEVASKYISLIKINSVEKFFEVFRYLKDNGITLIEIKKAFLIAMQQDETLNSFISDISYKYCCSTLIELGSSTKEEVFNSYFDYANKALSNIEKAQNNLVKQKMDYSTLCLLMDNEIDFDKKYKLLLSILTTGRIKDNNIFNKKFGISSNEFILIILKNSVLIKMITDNNDKKALDILFTLKSNINDRNSIIDFNNEIINRFLIDDLDENKVCKIIKTLSYDELSKLINIFCVTNRNDISRSLIDFCNNDKKDINNYLINILDDPKLLELLSKKTKSILK